MKKTEMKARVYNGKWNGKEVSEHGLECGKIDYRCLANQFDAVMNNYIYEWVGNQFGCFWEPMNEELEEEEIPDVYQWFIVNGKAAEFLTECGEYVVWNEETDIYLWGITHFGTSWDYVLTDIDIITDNDR